MPTTDESKVYTLSVEKAIEMLSGVPAIEMEDYSWTWGRPEDDESGQYVALYEEGRDGASLGIYLRESEGELVLSGHIDASGYADFEDDEAKKIFASRYRGAERFSR